MESVPPSSFSIVVLHDDDDDDDETWHSCVWVARYGVTILEFHWLRSLLKTSMKNNNPNRSKWNDPSITL